MASALDSLFAHAAVRRGGYYAFTCSHGVVDAQTDEALRGILNRADLTLPDGMPLVWFGRSKGHAVGRVSAPDFMEAALRDPRARSLRHYFYGASPEVVTRIARRAERLLGRGAIAGCHSPPMRPAGATEDPEILARMAQSHPHLIWVGLGLPKQEYWMASHAAHFQSSLMLGVGAAFDWFAGSQPRAPRWMRAAGLEWAHRVMSDPARLWPRYRRVVPRALTILGRDLMSGQGDR